MIIGYTVAEAVEMLDISPRAIRKYCHMVDVPLQNVGGRKVYIISDEKLQEIKRMVRPWGV